MHCLSLVERLLLVAGLASGRHFSLAGCSKVGCRPFRRTGMTNFRSNTKQPRFRKWFATVHKCSAKKEKLLTELVWAHVLLTYVVECDFTDHPRGHKSSYARPSVCHSKNSSREVRRNIETVTQIASCDSTVESQGHCEDRDCPILVISEENQKDEHQARSGDGKCCETL